MRNEFSEKIFYQKYAHDGARSWAELASTLVKDVCGDVRGIDHNYLGQMTQAIEKMHFIPGGRYLYYAGRPKKFFNNCYLLKGLEDTRQDWAELSKKSESCLATGGGIGADYSIYRPSGRLLAGTGGVASGPISKMQIINEIGRHIMQGGSRRSAIYASLNWKHGDINSFVTAKDWHKLPVGTTGLTYWDLKQQDFNFPCPLDMTNISVNYDTSWIMGYWKTGEVGDVFKNNVRQALSTGEPGFSFNLFDKENETLRNACVTADSLLLTPTGYYTIGSLVDQDVQVWNGENWSDTRVFSTGQNRIFEVKLSDGSVLNCTTYHKFILADGTRKPAGNLLAGDKLAKFDMPVMRDSGNQLLEDAYSKGFYCGDGNKGYAYSWLYAPKFMCQERLLGAFSEGNDKRKTWRHIRMQKDFVPVQGDRKSCLEWFAGLCDSDGTITSDKNGQGIQIASIDFDFLNRTRLMLTRLGVRAKIVSGNAEGMRNMPDGKGGSKEYSCKETKRLLVGNSDTYHLLQLGFNTSRLQFHGNPPQRDARRFVTVASVEDLGYEEETFCVTEPLENRMTVNGVVTGNCTEVTSADDSDVCNLGSINMSRINSLEEFASVVELATMFLIMGTIKAEMPYDKVYEVRNKNRRLGLGLMGIHEWLVQRGYKYEVTSELHRWLTVYRSVSDNVSRSFADTLSISRPVANRAIAPTGTIGIMAGTSTGIEPIFSVAYKRRYLKGTKWHYQYVVDGSAKDLIERYDANPDTIDSALSLADDYERRIKFQADIQDYVDMSISSTINLPSWNSRTNNEDLVVPFANTLAKYAHRLRGFTCYPDGSRGGQPLTSVPYQEAVKQLGTEYEEQFHDICDISGHGGSCGL